MRYRPFAHFELSVSAVTLALTDDHGARRVADWVALVFAAIEAGINSFEVHGRHPAIAQGLGQALQSVERRLIVAAWRHGPRSIPQQYAAQAFQPQIIQAAVKSALARSGLGHLDLLLLDDPGESDLPPQSLALLRDLKARGVIRYIGVSGEDEAIDAYISTGAFDALALPFNMGSGWRARLRLRAAQAHEMAVIGYDPCPPYLQPTPETQVKRGLFGRATPRPLPGAYDFMAYTPGWSPEEICLAFSLTEPALATVQVVAESIEQVRALADVAERDLPAGLAAQIEMARIDNGSERDGRRQA